MCKGLKPSAGNDCLTDLFLQVVNIVFVEQLVADVLAYRPSSELEILCRLQLSFMNDLNGAYMTHNMLLEFAQISARCRKQREMTF